MYKIRLSWVVIITLLSVHFTVQATALNNISISHTHIRASIPGTVHSSAYMRINNNSDKKVTLVKVSSNISPRIEMHNHVMNDDMMSMQQLQSIEINANSQVIFQPHGLHLMVFNLTESLKAKDIIEITLHFSNNHRVTVPFPVKSLKQI
jgi:copper(I)-binding protein